MIWIGIDSVANGDKNNRTIHFKKMHDIFNKIAVNYINCNVFLNFSWFCFYRFQHSLIYLIKMLNDIVVASPSMVFFIFLVWTQNPTLSLTRTMYWANKYLYLCSCDEYNKLILFTMGFFYYCLYSLGWAILVLENALKSVFYLMLFIVSAIFLIIYSPICIWFCPKNLSLLCN